MTLPDFINPAFLSAAMGTLVEACTAEQVGRREGHMADIRRLHLSGPAVPDSIIAKCAASNPVRRELATRYNSYRKEAMLYPLSNQLTGVRLPVCYYNAGPDRPFLLLLEDLGDTTPFTRDAADTTDTDLDPVRAQLTLAVHTLAAIHRVDTDLPAPDLAPGFEAASQDFSTFVLAYLNTLAPTRAVNLLKRYARHSIDYLPGFLEAPQVLCHMDFRAENLRMAAGELIVLDWGEYCLAPAGFDLALLLTTSIDETQRRSWEDSLIDEYALAADLSDRRSIFQSYRLSIPHSFYLAALAATYGNRDNAERLTARALAAVNDHLPFLETAFA